MSYTLDELAADIHRELARDRSSDGKEAVCRQVSRALTDREFVATHLKDRPTGTNPREILYQDPELGFCICGHVYGGKAIGSPHDHGSSWAIYGQATGVTEMTDWKIVEKGEADKPSLVEPVADLPDASRRRAVLRCRRGAFAQARSAGQAGPHRGQEPRSRQALQHQGRNSSGKPPRDAEHAALLRVELIEEAGFPGEILPRGLGVAVVTIMGEEQEIDAVGIGRAVRTKPRSAGRRRARPRIRPP